MSVSLIIVAVAIILIAVLVGVFGADLVDDNWDLDGRRW